MKNKKRPAIREDANQTAFRVAQVAIQLADKAVATLDVKQLASEATQYAVRQALTLQPGENLTRVDTFNGRSCLTRFHSSLNIPTDALQLVIESLIFSIEKSGGDRKHLNSVWLAQEGKNLLVSLGKRYFIIEQ